jgi:hypothetical protein
MLQVNRIFNGLSGLQKDLLDGRKGCGVECRTMQLGALTRLLNSTSLLHHSLEKDYQALSVGQLLKEVKAAACPTWYDSVKNRHDYYAYYKQQRTHKPHECPPPWNPFDVAIKSIANEVDEALKGLSITNYVRSATESSNGAVTGKPREKKKGKGKSVMEGTPS